MITIINLNPFFATCCMCEAEGDFDYAVPYYCEPVPEGYSEDTYSTVCETCYLKWYYEIQIPFEQSVINFEEKYFLNRSPKQ